MVDFILPDLGEGIHEAEIVSIRVKEGDTVAEDDILFEAETDKAVVEIPSPYAGVITKLYIEEGQTVNTGAVMVSFDVGDGGAKSAPEKRAQAAGASQQANALTSSTTTSRASESPATSPVAGGNGSAQPTARDRNLPVPAAPAVRRLAREMGIDLYNVPGSGKAGRVLKEDVRAFATGALESSMNAPQGTTSSVSPQYQKEEQLSLKDKYGGGATGVSPLTAQPGDLPNFEKYGAIERVPLKSIRRKIAVNMMQSWTRIPHVTTFDEADVTVLTELLKAHEEKVRKGQSTARLTLTSLAVKAVVSGLKRFPQFNSSLDESTGEIVFKQYYNIGVAVATERGLIVPVIHNADQKSLIEVAGELRDMAIKTRAGKIELDKLQGGTFTITNIGAIGGTSMSPMINYPEAAILGMARASERPVVRNGDIKVGVVLPLALSFDHRLADGAEAAMFVQHVVDLLSDPINFFLS